LELTDFWGPTDFSMDFAVWCWGTNFQSQISQAPAEQIVQAQANL